ncbi:DNRLRE domain-containing protein [Bacillus sp. FJAT-22090]|uniref:DNRLRE domain-containing protein n=1 Tax=Bacillus sp. FJAT-22090 TaxID=1581038 RepID=UPI00164241AC|nr:DNRLRE domain-containing protein [Bacillus sp. FJAT-22090]
MQHKIFTKWLANILVVVLIFTSIPITNLVVNAEENTEIEIEETPTLINPDELPTIASGEAPRFEKTEPKEVMELRTESSQVIDNGDGTYSMDMFQEPVFRENNGKWKDIQPKLKKQKAGKFFSSESNDELATENTLLDIRFSPKMNKNKYAVLAYKEHTLGYTFREATGEKGVQKVKNTAASYEENKIFYRDVIPGLTLRNIVFDESVKEDIILSHYNGTNNYHFFMETDLTAQIEDNGSITFRDQQNEIIYILPKPFMTDSKINPESAEPQRSDNVHFELSKEKKGYAFTVVADENWLKDPERVYPVYIDPTTKVQANQDASVSSAYPNANYGSDWDAGLGAYILKAGNYSSATGENFAYIKTPTPSLPYATIETAIFNIYNVHSYYPSTLTGIWLDRVNGSWDESSITWNNKPASSLFTSTSVYKGKWATFNVKNAVNDWMKGTTPNNGFKLHTNGNGQTFWKKFYSSEHSVADYRPHLNISYFYTSPSNLAAETTSLGDGTGYIDLKWDAVAGASSYNIWMFDGNEYKSINVGKSTTWSTKDKSVWPQVGANLPVNPQSVYRASGGTTYNDRTNYAISVSAVFANGESPKANPIVPTIPNLTMPKAPTGVAYSNQVGTNSGYINLEWEPVTGAAGYKVWMFNGLSYEAFDVKNTTNWTTQNKGIWPTDTEITNGSSTTLKLHQDGKGVELPLDPSPMYAKMGTKYATSKTYFFRVSAYNADGESVFSKDIFTTKMPKGTEFLGVEDYWTMIGVPNGAVNAATGNLLLSESDVAIPGTGPGLGITRAYNSLSPTVGIFGKGWHSNVEMSVVPQGQDAKFTDEDGTIHLFKKQINGTYQAPTGVYLELTETTNQYELKAKDQTIYYFTKSSGKLSKITDGHENSTDYLFTTNQITIKESFKDTSKNASARQISLSLDANGRVEKITDPLQRPITVDYQQDKLVKVTDSSGQVTQYEYDTNKDLVKLYEPRHLDQNETKSIPIITTYEYDNDRLKKITDAKNNLYSLDYEPSKKQLTLTKPNNKKAQYTFNEAGNPIQQIGDVGGLNLITSYVYEGNNLLEVKEPKDQDATTATETYKYDGDGNMTNVSINKGEMKYEYVYNGNNDVISSTSMENSGEKKTTYAYNGLDPVSETDQSGKVSSVTKYDSSGNVLESSDSLSAATNLVANNSFEKGTVSWVIEQKSNDSSMTIDPNASNGIMGKQGLKLQVKPVTINYKNGYVAAVQEIAVEAGKTYTLSGKVKTELTKANTFFKVQFLDSQNKLISEMDNRYSKLAGKRSWTDRQLTFKTPNNVTKTKIYLAVEHKDATASGDAWFDAIQLEKAEVSSSYNPIINSSFENGTSDWVGTGGTTVVNAFDGSKSLELTRSNSTQGPLVYNQTFDIRQASTDKPIPITLTGLSKAANVKVNGTGDKSYSIAATVTYTDNTAKIFTMDFPSGTQDWNRSAIHIPADKPIHEINVSLNFKGAYTGTVWFDAIRIMEGSIVTKHKYDGHGYQNETEDELGYKIASLYDEVGNKKEETDAKGFKKSFKYDYSDRLEKLALENGTSVDYQYDKNGNMKAKSITDSFGKTQQFNYEYDALDRLIKTTGPLNDIVSTIYNDQGNKTTTTLPNKNMIEQTYDGVDRLSSISYNNERFYSFAYDEKKNKESVTYVKEARIKEKTFDDTDRLITFTDRGGLQQWNYPRDSDKLTSFTFSQGGFTQTNNYTYNQLDQNTVVTAGGYTYRFDYDEKGNIQTFITGNGTGSTFNYDDRGLVTNLSIGTEDGSDILTEKYSYDANGNRTQIAYPNGESTSYEYDKLNQLTKETLPKGKMIEYDYDGFGNRKSVKTTENGQTTSKIATYNIANQLEQFDGDIIKYDANGNRMSDGKHSYKWDAADRLISVTKLGETTPFATYKYDEDGKRIQKNVNGVITNFHYDADSINVLYETDGQNNVIRNYTYSENGQLLSMKKGTQTFFYNYNAHGDVIALTNQSSQIVATYKYDAWGNILEADETNQVNDNSYRYAGYQYDQETGLYYLIARYYQPEQGVFLSLDPYAGDNDDMLSQNGYTYANNNPVMLVDPDGQLVRLVRVLGPSVFKLIKNTKKVKVKSKPKGYLGKLPGQGTVDAGVKGAPKVDAGKQGKHVPGHGNNVSTKSQWKKGQNGVQYTQEAWMKGTVVKPDGSVKIYDFGKPVGPNGATKVKVHLDKKGNIHGYPIK